MNWTAPWASVNTDKQLAELQARLASDPEWHGGRYYGKAACKTVLTDIRVETLKRYGIETALTPRWGFHDNLIANGNSRSAAS
jgi:hypothetical protein